MVGSYLSAVVDIGNSGLKGALLDGNLSEWTGEVRSLYWLAESHISKPPPEEFKQGNDWVAIDDQRVIARWVDALRSTADDSDLPIHWRVSSVQPRALQTFEAVLRSMYSHDRLEVVTDSHVPMPKEVDLPGNVGIDRLLAAWEAWESSSKEHPVIVIQAGTAVTVDWIDERGVYSGGAIMPGLSLTLKYLAFGTAHLPWLAPPTDLRNINVPGKNTHDAILAGVTASFVGGIEQLQRQYRERYDGSPDRIETVISGGDRSALAQAVAGRYRAVEHLVLVALRRLVKGEVMKEEMRGR